jgi:hypothetical protein
MHINLLDKELVKFKASHIKGFFILLLLLIFPFKFFNEIKKSGLDKSNQMANFILEHSSPTDSILAYPGDPGLYCLTKRQPASRFYFLAPWLASEEILNTVVRDIRTNKPKLIVLRKDFEADLNFLPIHQEIWSQYEIHGGEEGLSQYSIYQLKKDVIPTQ